MTWDPIAARVKTAGAERSPELEALAAKWQEVLGIQDWTVRVRLTRGFDMKPDTLGHVNPTPSARQAVIDVKHPEDIEPETWGLFPEQCDQEYVVVHELVHLVFAPFATDETGAVHDAEELAVHKLARALVTLSREAKA